MGHGEKDTPGHVIKFSTAVVVMYNCDGTKKHPLQRPVEEEKL